MSLYLMIGGALITLLVLTFIIALSWRTVVSTNEVHIVQSAKRTVSFGKGETAGNTYYKWPSWIPVIGVKTSVLPMSVFDLKLNNYESYDKDRVPFVIDIMAFFRIKDSNVAAQRVHSIEELDQQLEGILQGSCRSILATNDLEHILEGRTTFGELFTRAVDGNLEHWGLQTVKNIELMDIRDSQGSHAIHNIMAKKQSLIDRESRVAVAENSRAAQVAEIEAKQAVEVRGQEAAQKVGIRSAEKDREVGISNQMAAQAIKEQERATAEKDMAVKQVQRVREAEIIRGVELVAADQAKQVAVITAEGSRQQTILVAEGALQSAKLHANGVEIEGRAEGAAKQAVLLAPVNAQITLAKEIGANDKYQEYLLGVREIEKNQVVGVAQAAALEDAEIKVIANSGDVISGVSGVMDLLTAKGGTQIGAMVEAFAQTPAGAAVIQRLSGNGNGNGNGAR